MSRSSQSDPAWTAAAWLRSAQVAVYAFISVAAVSGVCYGFYSAFLGNALGALAGGLIAVGGVTCGFLALAGAHFGYMLLARTEHLERLTSRLETLEQAFEAQGVPVDLVRTGADEPEQLVAANLERDMFPRLAKAGETEPPAEAPGQEAERAEEASAEGQADLELQWQSAYQEGDVAACRRVLESLRRFVDGSRIVRMEESLSALGQARSAQLREEFADSVRRRNYEAALLAGEQIERAFPDSAMAREFQDLRPHLERRAKAQHVSAV